MESSKITKIWNFCFLDKDSHQKQIEYKHKRNTLPYSNVIGIESPICLCFPWTLNLIQISFLYSKLLFLLSKPYSIKYFQLKYYFKNVFLTFETWGFQTPKMFSPSLNILWNLRVFIWLQKYKMDFLNFMLFKRMFNFYPLNSPFQLFYYWKYFKSP